MNHRAIIAALATANLALLALSVHLWTRPAAPVVLDEVQRLRIDTETTLMHIAFAAHDEAGEYQRTEIVLRPRAAIGLHYELGQMLAIIHQTATGAAESPPVEVH